MVHRGGKALQQECKKACKREMDAGILLASSICPSYSVRNPNPWDGAVCIQGEPSLLVESSLEMPSLLHPKVCVLLDAKPIQLDHG